MKQINYRLWAKLLDIKPVFAASSSYQDLEERAEAFLSVGINVREVLMMIPRLPKLALLGRKPIGRFNYSPKMNLEKALLGKEVFHRGFEDILKKLDCIQNKNYRNIAGQIITKWRFAPAFGMLLYRGILPYGCPKAFGSAWDLQEISGIPKSYEDMAFNYLAAPDDIIARLCGKPENKVPNFLEAAGVRYVARSEGDNTKVKFTPFMLEVRERAIKLIKDGETDLEQILEVLPNIWDTEVFEDTLYGFYNFDVVNFCIEKDDEPCLSAAPVDVELLRDSAEKIKENRVPKAVLDNIIKCLKSLLGISSEPGDFAMSSDIPIIVKIFDILNGIKEKMDRQVKRSAKLDEELISLAGKLAVMNEIFGTLSDLMAEA